MNTLAKNIKIPWDRDEEERFKSYLKREGKKAGPFVRVLLLREMERSDLLESGKTQIDLDAIRSLSGKAEKEVLS